MIRIHKAMIKCNSSKCRYMYTYTSFYVMFVIFTKSKKWEKVYLLELFPANWLHPETVVEVCCYWQPFHLCHLHASRQTHPPPVVCNKTKESKSFLINWIIRNVFMISFMISDHLICNMNTSIFTQSGQVNQYMLFLYAFFQNIFLKIYRWLSMARTSIS